MSYEDRTDAYDPDERYDEPRAYAEYAYEDEPPYVPAPFGAPLQPGPDGGRPAVMPAHPLPQYRSGKLDYDRYLEASTSKFKIFSAETRRQRNRTLAMAAGILAVVVIVIVWAILSQP